MFDKHKKCQDVSETVCVRACVCVCVTVKRPVLPPCAVDGRSRNPLYYYYYYYYFLHWLPVEQRIEYKLSSLCFKITSHQAPIYLSELVHLYTPSRQLRSSTDIRVSRIRPFRTKSCGQSSLSYQAPVIWNQLPVSVRHSTSLGSFKSSLKTFLF